MYKKALPVSYCPRLTTVLYTQWTTHRTRVNGSEKYYPLDFGFCHEITVAHENGRWRYATRPTVASTCLLAIFVANSIYFRTSTQYTVGVIVKFIKNKPGTYVSSSSCVFLFIFTIQTFFTLKPANLMRVPRNHERVRLATIVRVHSAGIRRYTQKRCKRGCEIPSVPRRAIEFSSQTDRNPGKFIYTYYLSRGLCGVVIWSCKRNSFNSSWFRDNTSHRTKCCTRRDRCNAMQRKIGRVRVIERFRTSLWKLWIWEGNKLCNILLRV